MFKDHTKTHILTKAISAREGENEITELIYWVKSNIDNARVEVFTQGRFSDVDELVSALQEVYQELGVEGVKGNTSDYLLFIAGDKKNKIYLSHVIALDKSKHQVFANKLGMDVKVIDNNLSKLDWRKNVSI